MKRRTHRLRQVIKAAIRRMQAKGQERKRKSDATPIAKIKSPKKVLRKGFKKIAKIKRLK